VTKASIASTSLGAEGLGGRTGARSGIALEFKVFFTPFDLAGEVVSSLVDFDFFGGGSTVQRL
jgi:hypothetical protein